MIAQLQMYASLNYTRTSAKLQVLLMHSLYLHKHCD